MFTLGSWKLKVGGATLEERPEGKQDYLHRRFDAVYSGASLPVLRRIFVPPLSGTAHPDQGDSRFLLISLAVSTPVPQYVTSPIAITWGSAAFAEGIKFSRHKGHLPTGSFSYYMSYRRFL
jgi:hypothetical protein